MRRILAFCLIALWLPTAPCAELRRALVIGNDAYRDVPALEKAGSDARSVAGRLAALGFETIVATDADRREMNRQISEFIARLDPGDTAFLFFAGHGVEIDGENYLLPTDIPVPASGEEDFVKSEAIPLSRLLDRVWGSGAQAVIAVIDACRNNPFASTTERSIGTVRGLGRIAAPQGTFVVFSAGAGQLALDELTENDPDANSVFTRSLLPLLDRPGLELRSMVAELRDDVRHLAGTVNHVQIPAYYDEFIGDFFFRSATGPAQPAPPRTGRRRRSDARRFRPGAQRRHGGGVEKLS